MLRCSPPPLAAMSGGSSHNVEMLQEVDPEMPELVQSEDEESDDESADSSVQIWEVDPNYLGLTFYWTLGIGLL